MLLPIKRCLAGGAPLSLLTSCAGSLCRSRSGKEGSNAGVVLVSSNTLRSKGGYQGARLSSVFGEQGRVRSGSVPFEYKAVDNGWGVPLPYITSMEYIFSVLNGQRVNLNQILPLYIRE